MRFPMSLLWAAYKISLILHYFIEFDSFGGRLPHSGWR